MLLTKKRRLRAKIAPAAVPAFPRRALLKRLEYQVRKSKLKKAQLEQRNAQKEIRRKAVELLSKQVEANTGDSDDDVAAVPLQSPHPSHHITTLASSKEVIWCKACACWSLRSKLRGLAARCEGMKLGKRSSLRLLQCGVMPAPKARIPPALLKKRARKGRW